LAFTRGMERDGREKGKGWVSIQALADLPPWPAQEYVASILARSQARSARPSFVLMRLPRWGGVGVLLPPHLALVVVGVAGGGPVEGAVTALAAAGGGVGGVCWRCGRLVNKGFRCFDRPRP